MTNIKYITEQIFKEDGFEQSDKFFYKDGGYFAMHFCEGDEIKNFFEDDRVNDIISLRDDIAKSDRNALKNLSLIIFLKIDEIKNFENYKNYILKIEEDEYFFRKYVLVYDELGEQELLGKLNGKNILEKLNDFLYEMNFNRFKENRFSSSFDWLIIQLFVKLPFLRIDVTGKEFQNLSNTIEKKLTESDLEKLNTFILNNSFFGAERTLDKEEILNTEDPEIKNFFNNLSASIGK